MKDHKQWIEALDSITWYNCLARYVFFWRDIEDSSGIPLESYGAECKEDELQLQIIWMIGVALYGDWGTSQRYGWIEDYEGFKEWVLAITETWRSSDDYEGPEEFRIKREVITLEDLRKREMEHDG